MVSLLFGLALVAAAVFMLRAAKPHAQVEIWQHQLATLRQRLEAEVARA